VSSSGFHSVYWPTKNSFRVFLKANTALTPEDAEAKRFQVSWIGADSMDLQAGQDDSYHWKIDPHGGGCSLEVTTEAVRSATVVVASTETIGIDLVMCNRRHLILPIKIT
jgi:hypothetical protein